MLDSRQASPNGSDCQPYLSEDDLRTLRVAFYTVIFSSLLYGIFVVVGAQTVYVLVRRASKETKARRAMLGATLLMLISSTIIWATGDLYYYIARLSSLGIARYEPTQAFQIAWAVIFFTSRTSYLLSDVVLIWRAWVLWSESRPARIALGICLIGSAGAAFTEAAFNVVDQIRDGRIGMVIEAKALILFAPLLVTNIVATTLIAIKAWSFHKEGKLDLGSSSGKRVGQVLRLMVESGFIYCILWTLYAICQVSSAVLNNDKVDSVLPMTMPHISGIYPAVVILLVARETPRQEADLPTMQFSDEMTSISQSQPRASSEGTTTTGRPPALRLDLYISQPSSETLSLRHGASADKKSEDMTLESLKSIRF